MFTFLVVIHHNTQFANNKHIILIEDNKKSTRMGHRNPFVGILYTLLQHREMCCVCVDYSSTDTQKMKWIKATQRSSHSIAVLHEKIYLIGGELEPKVPIDIDDLFVYISNTKIFEQ
jgi:hypothetical protein